MVQQSKLKIFFLKKGFFGTKEFPLKLCGSPYPRGFHDLHGFTKPEGNLSKWLHSVALTSSP